MDLFSNERFVAFRNALESKGLALKVLWSCNNGSLDFDTGKRFKYDNVFMFAVCGRLAGDKQPKVATVIVQDYGGKNGIGLWFDTVSNSLDDDIAFVTGETCIRA